MKIRTRIAPSPTGEDIHIGNLYTALINYVFAKKNKGQFIIRIEDTDQERYVKGAEEKILKTLKAFDLDYDEGPDKNGPFAPYRQSERLPIYHKYARELVSQKKAYYCFCSKERLLALRKKQLEEKKVPRYDKFCLDATNAEERIGKDEPYIIRLNVVPNKKVRFTDVIRGKIEFDSNQIDDQILIKSDGYPTYHMSVVIDDHLMEISHVIRAEEWISSTPKHVMLYESFGWKLPIFAHLPILRNKDRSKLSKRKNPVWASWYLEEGFLPAAVLNFLALMGWSHPDQKEKFTIAEFTKLFELEDIKPVGPVFDIKKLEWLNGVWIRKLYEEDREKLKAMLLDFYIDDKSVLDILQGQKAGVFLSAASSRMKTLKDFKGLVLDTRKERASTGEDRKIAKILLEKLQGFGNDLSDEELLQLMRDVRGKTNASYKTLYFLFTGREQGLPILDLKKIYGKEFFIKNLEEVK